MAAQHSTNTDFTSRYKFNSLVPTHVGRKELDTETGWYYYGARYYNPSTSTWLSVDPLAEKYQSFSPYNYTLNNPINLVDADGRQVDDCCSFKELKVKYKYVKKQISKAVDYAKEHFVVSLSATPSVGFQAGVGTQYGKVSFGLATTKGNTYLLSNKEGVTVKETDLKQHNYLSTSVGVKKNLNVGMKFGN